MKTRPLTGFVLAVLLIAAQGALALHAFEHDPGAPQGKVCGTCVTASQLAAGSVDSHAGESLPPARQLFVQSAHRGFESRHAAPVRQRGPPPFS
jgi:hypothetical protein